MKQARCESCGGFAPLNFDRHGNPTCPYCGPSRFERDAQGARIGVALLAASAVASLLLLWGAWHVVATLLP